MEPTTDLDSAPFFDALRRHEVVVQSCAACGRARFGRLGSCPHCGTLGGDDVTVSGRGVVYSFVRAHRALSETMAGEVPYAIGTIELDNGARLLGRVEPVEACAIGVAVTPRFVDHATWTELRFVVIS